MKERGFFYHQWTLLDLKRHFDVDFETGLSKRRADLRLHKYGPNSLDDLKENTLSQIIIRQFLNFFIILLFIAAIVSYFVDGILQSFILVIIALLNVGLGFYQEYKAEKALNDLKESFKAKSKVLRDGKVFITDNDELVPGDIVFINAGDLVPADIRIIESEGLVVNESTLTGESVPVSKVSTILDLDTALGDRVNMLYGSTVAVAGRAKGIVVLTGGKTEFGEITNLVNKADDKTPLELQILFLGKVLTIASIIVSALIFALGYIRGFELLPLLTFTIAVLVSAVPESLPTVITLSLAIGVSRMAKKKAIVRKLSAVETLGTVNIIATDKTGTLTNNELLVKEAVIFKDHTLYDFNLDKDNPTSELLDLFTKGLVCSDISLKNEKGDILGDPVEIAIATAAKKFESGLITKSKVYKRISEIPFDSENKYMAVTASLREEKEIITKGSFESIISFCSISDKDKKNITNKAEYLGKSGYKVIALAYKKLDKSSSGALSSMSFMGLLALSDEPALGVSDAIKKAIESGIRVVVITGDHEETARHVANEIGLEVLDDEIMSGEDVDNLLNRSIRKHLLKKVKIFARITPIHKINIVKAFQKAGYSVAVTGDGVNDAPALKEANVGIAMGIKGTEVAKDSADIVLSDDKFETIISAIEYGRAIYDNIRNAIIFLLSGNAGEIILIGFAFLFDLPIPILTIQILWVNMVTDSLPAIALAFQKPSASVLRQKPRPIKSNSMRVPIFYAICLSLVTFSIGLILYLWGIGYSVEKARTLVFTFFVFSELVFCLSINSPHRIWQNFKSFFSNKFLVATISISAFFQILIFLPKIRDIFSIVILSPNEIGVIFIATASAFILAELIRHAFNVKLFDFSGDSNEFEKQRMRPFRS